MEDPFAILGLRPDASAKAVHAAYRRLAKRLHPDVRGTGDATAYARLRAAYDAARAPRPAGAGAGAGAEEYGPEHVGAWAMRHAASEAPGWEQAVEPQAGPRPFFRVHGLRAMVISIGIGVAVASGVQFARRPVAAMPAPRARAVPFSEPSPAVRSAEPPIAVAGPGAPEAGVATPEAAYFVAPAAAPATLFRYDAATRHYVPDGVLGAFAPVRVSRLLPGSGMAAVDGDDGKPGRFVLMQGLQPGDATAARLNQCVFDAGRPPVPGEVLRATGVAAASLVRRVPVENRGDVAAVFALRDAAGHPVASVYVGPHDTATLPPLPAGEYRAEWASGDLWSRACDRFLAGARAARAKEAGALPDRYVLPLAGAAELPDGGLE